MTNATTPTATSEKITVVQSTSPDRVCKTYSISKSGELQKSSIANIRDGVGMSYQADTAGELAEILRKVCSRQNLVVIPGTWRNDSGGKFRVTTRKELFDAAGMAIDAKDPDGLIEVDGELIGARLKESIVQSKWILIDADNPPGIPDTWAAMSLKDRLEALETALPGISECERIELRGSSARVSQGENQNGATHAWIRISDPSKIDMLRTAASVLTANNALAFDSPRYARKTGEQTGSAKRSLIDFSVWCVGRIVFCAEPDVSRAEGYSVADPAIQIVNAGAGEWNIGWLSDWEDEAYRDGQLKTYADSTGKSLSVSSDGNRISVVSEGELTLETPIERNYKVKPLGVIAEGLKPGQKYRCETPFRESQSEAAFIRLGDDGVPFLFDVGTGITYRLSTDEAKTFRKVEEPEWEEPEPGHEFDDIGDVPSIEWRGVPKEINDAFLSAMTYRNQPVADLMTISFLSQVCARHFVGPTGLGFNNSILVMADTGWGKDHIINCYSKLMDSAGLIDEEHAGWFASAQALHKHLESNPSIACIVNEIGKQFKHSNNKSNTLGGGLTSFVIQLFNATTRAAFKPLNASLSTDLKPLPYPHLSIAAFTTDAEVSEIVSEQSITDGNINRWLFYPVIDDRSGEKNRHGYAPTIPVGLDAWAVGIRNAALAGMLVGKPGHGEFQKVGWGEGCMKLFEDLRDQQDDFCATSEKIPAKMYARVVEHSLKVAAVLSLCNHPEVINKNLLAADLQVAFNFVSPVVTRFIKYAEKSGVTEDSKENAAAGQIMRALRKYKRLSRSSLSKFSRSFGKLEITRQNVLLKSMRDMGMVRLKEYGGGLTVELGGK